MIKNTRKFDILDMQRVNDYLEERYGKNDIYKAAAETDAFQAYVKECAKVSWDLCVQTPPMVIDCNAREFNPEMTTGPPCYRLARDRYFLKE